MTPLGMRRLWSRHWRPFVDSKRGDGGCNIVIVVVVVVVACREDQSLIVLSP